MKVILLFDSDKPENSYREYELLDTADDALRKGEWCDITFCHPAHGEVFIQKTAVHEEIFN